MDPSSALEKLREVIRRKHLALSTEETYAGWLTRFMEFISKRPEIKTHTREQKIEAFLTRLAKSGVAASTQNQAFNAILFFYRQVLLVEVGRVDALRAKRPTTIRTAPTMEEMGRLLKTVTDVHDYPTKLIIHLLYGCGLRVCEPLNLRIKDVVLLQSQLIIRGAKGGKDRIVPIPCSLVGAIKAQLKFARVMWERDAAAGVPVPLPGLLARKYPRAGLTWPWAWLFPSGATCRHPRTGERVRWRVHEANVQLSVRVAARALGLAVTPHHLRHAYATHALRAGANVRDLQSALGHASLETTMGYITPQACAVASPLEMLA